MKILVASHNQHKLRELRQLAIGSNLEFLSLNEIGFFEDILETGKSFQENAFIKLRHIGELYEGNIISEDSGLEVFALGGEPGIYSARYAGAAKDDLANTQKVLQRLKAHSNRSARYVCYLAARIDGNFIGFEGEIRGTIAEVASGNEGFGYDPIFIPENYDKSFGQLPPELKNRISHRTRAAMAFFEYLLGQKKK